MIKFYVFFVVSLVISIGHTQQKSDVQTLDTKTELKNDNNEKTQEPQKIEKMEVTGSFIRRIEVEGPSPTKIIGKEKFKQTGNNTVSELLRDDVNFQQAVTTPSGGYSNKSNEGYFYYRWQHAGNTLVLLNGMRLPKENGSFYTSLSYIPAAAVERIEMLKDGASAVYGSDAMAGVVNFITKKNVSGGTVDAQYNISERGIGQLQNYSINAGTDIGKFNVMGVIQYQKTSPYFESALGSYAQNPKYSNKIGSSSLVKAKNLDNSETTLSSGLSCTKGSECETDPNLLSQTQASINDISGLVSGKYESESGAEVSITSIYSHRDTLDSGLPLRLQFNGLKSSEITPSLASQKVFGKVSDFQTASGVIRPVDELGLYTTNKVADTSTTQVQLKTFVSDTWDIRWQNSYSFQNVDYKTISGDANRFEMLESLKSGEYVLGQKNSLVASFENPTRRYRGRLANSRLITSGELTSFFEGSIAAAFGAEIEYEDFRYNHDEIVTQDVLLSNRAYNFSGFRRNQALFSEFTLTPLDNFEIQLAARSDNYSDVGSTINPKIALAIRPDKKSLIRASVSRGFKPPGVSDPFAPSVVLMGRQFDDVMTGKRVTKDINVQANPNLSYETGTNINFGVAFEPLKNFTVTLDQWNFLGRGSISDMSGTMATLIEKTLGQEALANFGAKIERDPTTNEISFIQVPNIYNRYKKSLRGLDVGFNWQAYLKSYHFNFDSNASILLERKEQQLITDIVQDLPLYGSQLDNSVSISDNKNYLRFGARTLLNGTSASRPFNDSPGFNFPVYTEYNLTYAYTTSWDGKLTLGVRNLLDTVPYTNLNNDLVQFSNTSSLFSPLRRRFFMGYTQTF